MGTTDDPKGCTRPYVEIRPPKYGVARTYGELIYLLREHRYSLGLSQLDVDHIAGLQDGYTGKLEQPNKHYGRRAVHPMFNLWLGGLGVGLMVVPLDDEEEGVSNE